MSLADRADPAGNRLLAAIRRQQVMLMARSARVFAEDADASLSGTRIGTWLARQIETERLARSSFHLVPLGLMIGIASFYAGGFTLLLTLALAGVILSLALAYAMGSTSRRGLLVLIACALAGGGLADWELRRTQTTILSGEVTVRIEGRVLWRDDDDKGRARYRLRLTGTERPRLSRPPEIVQVLISSRHDRIPVGGEFRGLVRLRPPSGPAYPGGYDFAFAPFFNGLGAYGFGLGAPEFPKPAASLSPPSWQEAAAIRIAALRLAISDRIRSIIGGAEGAVAAALVTGERSGIPEEVNEWLRATGLAHVLSISGFHMALVAGFAMGGSRAVFAAVPGLALSWPTKKWAAAVALAVSAGYLLISGYGVATQRSFIMLCIMLVAVMYDRPALTLRNVAIAATLVLVIAPHELLTASFQMSFAATAALVGCFGAFSRWWSSRREARAETPRALPGKILLLLLGLGASSLIAGAASAPYAAFHFQRVAPFGLVANMIAMPLFSFWIMPLALLSMLAMPFGLDAPLLHLVGYGLAAVFHLAEALFELLADRPTGLMSPSSLLVLTAALLAVAFLASALRWAAIPLLAAGLVLAPSRGPMPEILIFEDGKELALVGADGGLRYLRARPNGFVAEQWNRAFAPSGEAAGSSPGFSCEERLCRAVTRSGLRIVWTDDYEETGRACDEADIAVVARAIRLRTCRSGARLVTLRTLRRTGSLAISRQLDTRKLNIEGAITDLDEPWNRHRRAAWPEYWKKPETAAPLQEAVAGASPNGSGLYQVPAAPKAAHGILAVGDPRRLEEPAQ